MTAFRVNPQSDRPTTALVSRVGVGNVDLQCGLRNVPVASPLSTTDIEIGDRVALTWNMSQPYVTANLSDTGSSRAGNTSTTRTVTVYQAIDVHSVDGFHAYPTPVAGSLLALDAGAEFPASVYGDAYLCDGSRDQTAAWTLDHAVTHKVVDGMVNAAHPDFANIFAGINWAQSFSYKGAFIPAGTYATADTITITTSGFILDMSPEADIQYTGTGWALQIGQTGVVIQDVIVRGGHFQRAGGNCEGGVLIWNAQKVSLYNVKSTGWKDSAVATAYAFKVYSDTSNGSMTRFYACEADDTKYGVWVTGSADHPSHGTVIQDCRIRGAQGSVPAGSRGICIENGRFAVVRGGTVTWCGVGIYVGLDNNTTILTRDGSFTDTYIERCTLGLSIDASSTPHRLMGLTFFNNTTDYSIPHGLWLEMPGYESPLLKIVYPVDLKLDDGSGASPKFRAIGESNAEARLYHNNADGWLDTTGGDLVLDPYEELVVKVGAYNMRLEYDVANYATFGLSSGGNLTIAPTAQLILNPASHYVRLKYDAVYYADLSIGATGIMTIAPVGDLVLDPTGSDVLPGGSVRDDLGDYNRKWRQLYAEELIVQTLVAQYVIATLGGQILVTPTTRLIADVDSLDTTIDVAHNCLHGGSDPTAKGKYIIFKAAPSGVPQVEVMKCADAEPTVIAGGYRYTVTRGVGPVSATFWGSGFWGSGFWGDAFWADETTGSTPKNWYAGDAVASLGREVGEGYIDLTSTSTLLEHLGPTMTIYTRTGESAWNDLAATVAVGNLESLLDYTAAEFGFAAGDDLTVDPSTGGFTGVALDRVNGLRLWNTDIELWNLTKRTVEIQNDGDVYFGKDIGGSDISFQHTAASGITLLGRKVAGKGWLEFDPADADLEIGYGVSSVILQVDADAGKMLIEGEVHVNNGALFAGNDSVWLDVNGISREITSSSLKEDRWDDNGDGVVEIEAYYSGTGPNKKLWWTLLGYDNIVDSGYDKGYMAMGLTCSLGTIYASYEHDAAGFSGINLHIGNAGNAAAAEITHGSTVLLWAGGASELLGVKTAVPYYDLDVNGDIRLRSSEKLFFGGTGSGDADVELYRSAANVLCTPDTMKAGGYQSADGTAGMTGTVTFTDNDSYAHTVTIKNGLITAWTKI